MPWQIFKAHLSVYLCIYLKINPDYVTSQSRQGKNPDGSFVVVLKCVPHAGQTNGRISNSVTKLNHVCKWSINMDTQKYTHHSQTLPDNLDIIRVGPPPPIPSAWTVEIVKYGKSAVNHESIACHLRDSGTDMGTFRRFLALHHCTSGRGLELAVPLWLASCHWDNALSSKWSTEVLVWKLRLPLWDYTLCWSFA